MNIQQYKQYDHRTHIYKKPDMYIGADDKVSREEWIYNFETKKIENKIIDFVPGCERIYLEILTNASDNIGRSNRKNINSGNIEVIMEDQWIKIKNYGLPIPIEIHPENNIYIPQMIFGSLLTSSNYEVDRHEAGTNGIGAKATNIFSKEFKVIIFNLDKKLKYTQIWKNNMKEMSEPLIEKCNDKESSVEIQYLMDFKKFNYNEEKYPKEAFNLFARHAIDISFTSKTKISFNNELFNVSNIKDYAKLYFNNIEDSIVFKDNNTELIVIDTPDEGYHVSFVNCMMTREGGVHVNSALKTIGDGVLKNVNETIEKQIKNLDDKAKKSHKITMNDLKPHISLLLSVKVVNPKFTSQTKSNLHSPIPKINIPENILKPIYKWKLIDRLHAALTAKQFQNLTKSDGKCKKYVKLLKGIDANFAGKEERKKCILYITEGKSGASYANKLISLVEGGRDYVGILPMKGKSLNVMKADDIQIGNNTEINELKKMVGLSEKTEYTDLSKLRYGSIMLMADSDVDGKHIIGLLINFFYCRYPSLLKLGYLSIYKTPTIRVNLFKNSNKFYSEQEYLKWKQSIDNYKVWNHKYYKGLGTSNDKEIEEDYKNKRIVSCIYDDKAEENIKLAFNKDLTDKRKEWVDNWKPYLDDDADKVQEISKFINNELILFSIANNERSLPKFSDGLKESQRKILYAVHKKWNIGINKNYSEIKVAQFSAYVADITKYHHGESILNKVIVGMTQNFTGSNNISWFYEGGQFGTRYEGGKDASETRYSYIKPKPILSYILRKEDFPILEYEIDEGEQIEPKTFYPIIPMLIINGVNGIGTGYSSYIPNYNPKDVINWYINKLENKPINNLIPWFDNFEGEIKIDNRKVIINKDEIDNDELIQENKEHLISISTLGKFNSYLDKKIIITELPIGRWPINYHKWLENLVENKKIKGFNDNSVKNKVYFEIIGFNEHPTIKNLKLKKSMGLSNMVALDTNNKPYNFLNINEILEKFYEYRLPIYQKRKEFIINELDKNIIELNYKIKFIENIINNNINVINTKLSDIYEKLKELNIPKEIYDSSKIDNLSNDKIIKLNNLINIKNTEKETLINTDIKTIWLNELKELLVQLNKK